jgi:hypothetical protein
MSHEKIDAAVVAAIAHCGVGDDRFNPLSDYIAALETDPGWQEHEVINLKKRIERLMSFPQ